MRLLGLVLVANGFDEHISAEDQVREKALKRVRKTEFRLKQEAKQRAARALVNTKKRLGLGEPQPPRGIVPDPLVATSLPRRTRPAPTSDRIPGNAASGDLLHAHKWKHGVRESDATTREMQRKAGQIAPAYNKGALQYLPNSQKDEWPDRDEQIASSQTKKPLGNRKRVT
jgi:hypothetical protein